MTAIPKTVKVGPFNYTVSHDKLEFAERKAVENLSRLCGCTDPEAEMIWINPDLSLGQKKDTLLHELLHAELEMIAHGKAWFQTFVQDGKGKEMEEDLVRRLAPALLALLKDNKNLVAFLTET